jgi:hypothetical protein
MISTCVSPTNAVMNMSDLMRYISSFCKYKELGALQCVSKEWCKIAGEDQFWQKLFTCHFAHRFFPGEELPTNQYREAFKNKLMPICPETFPEVKKVIITFMCQLKWDTKRQLVCEFPCKRSFNNSYYFIIQQGFGPKRGTEEGFKGAPEEVKYLQYNGNIIQTKQGESFSGYRFPVSHQPLYGKATLSTKSCGFVPVEYDIFGDKFFAIRDEGVSQIGYLNTPFDNCVKEELEIDVGWGNTLGYFSAVNDWKSPFELYYGMGEAPQPVWSGLFPKQYYFKFVLIAENGGITWERLQGNRFLSATYGFSLKADCNRTPIQF